MYRVPGAWRSAPGVGSFALSLFPGASMNADAELCRRIVEQMADALVFADRDGVIRLWNAGAEALFGHTAGEALGASLDLIVPEDLRQAHWEAYHRALAEGATKYGREPLLTRTARKDGTRIYVDMGLAVVTDARDRATGAVALLRDVTERRRRERDMKSRIAELEQRLDGEGEGEAS